jgi:hypothetical protein
MARQVLKNIIREKNYCTATNLTSYAPSANSHIFHHEFEYKLCTLFLESKFFLNAFLDQGNLCHQLAEHMS